MNYNVSPAKSLYRVVDAPIMIQFTIYTQAHIIKDPPSTFPSFIYRLTNFDQIPGVVGKTESFVGNDYPYEYICTCGAWFLYFSCLLKKNVLGVVADIKPLKQASQINMSLIRDITIKDSRLVHTPL
jgi:hypothetical protein